MGESISPAPGASSTPTPAVPGPPPEAIDKYDPGWTNDEWRQQAGRLGLGEGEARDLVPATSRAMAEFGAAGLQQVIAEAERLGMDGNFVRVLGGAGRDHLSRQAQLETLRADVARKAAQQGVSIARPKPARLNAQDLTRAVDRFQTLHFSQPQPALAAFLSRPQVRATMQNIIQADHEDQHAIEYYAARNAELDAHWESHESWRTLPDGSELRRGEVDILLNEAWAARGRAQREGASPNTVKALNARITMLNKIMFDRRG
jgi:hypothetical protein